jgi:thiol-disulfide isomerase/thioredoxin
MGQTQTRKQKILGDVKKARRQRLIISTIIITVLAVGIVAGIILLTPKTPPSPLIGQPISPTMNNYLAGVTNKTLATVGSGTGVTAMQQISGYSSLTFNGKPEFLYVGAEYCPYCAAERWSMIVALSRFGTFTGLEYMMSTDTDVYPNTPTFTFINAQYNSPYISFVSVETRDRNNKPLQSLTSDQNNIVNTIDCPTLGSNQQCGGLAFIDIANKWIMGGAHAGAQFQAFGSTTCEYFCGQGNWTQMGSQLDNPISAVAQAVDGAANTIITAICNVDGGQPNSLCSQSFASVQAPISATNAPPANSFNMITAPDRAADDSVWRSFPRLISS